MSGLHYKNDGTLDMRFSSSKAAVSSGYSGYGSGSSFSSGGRSSSSNYYTARQSYSEIRSSGSFDLHYKKDGTLDMRFGSSKAAVASGSHGNSYSGGSYSSGYSSPSTNDQHHYKKDGTLDMRFNTSKQAVNSDSKSTLRSNSRTSERTSATNTRSVSRASAAGDELHVKKDGTLDMRFKSSKAAAAITTALGKVSLGSTDIPPHVPRTRMGLPDMRTKAAKEWVAVQARNNQGNIPSWVPTRKDGTVDMTKAAGQEFLKQLKTNNAMPVYKAERRRDYYCKKMREDELFSALVKSVRQQAIESETTYYDASYLGPVTFPPTPSGSLDMNQLPVKEMLSLERTHNNDIEEVNFAEINLKPEGTLGKGGFGEVKKGTWKGRTVAVKILHLQKLAHRDKKSFLTEVKILSAFSGHPNLVTLYGYSLDPLALILEFVELGSLSHLLHYNEDPEIEANITDGRIKKRIAIGIVTGMIRLHEANVVHGDLKPQNVLVTRNYDAKITDFGLATIRGKTTSLVGSAEIHNEDNAVGGTAAYMAPELLDSSDMPELNVDVYSFGIVLNEIVQEEEPYTDQCRNFLGRGPFAAANHAKLGNRPRIDPSTPSNVKRIIESCWNANPRRRPPFKDILEVMRSQEFVIPNAI